MMLLLKTKKKKKIISTVVLKVTTPISMMTGEIIMWGNIDHILMTREEGE